MQNSYVPHGQKVFNPTDEKYMPKNQMPKLLKKKKIPNENHLHKIYSKNKEQNPITQLE